MEADDTLANKEKTFSDFEEGPYHQTILGRDSASSVSVSLQRCALPHCCQNKVHCPFCDVCQYKPAQPSRVKDHLHLTHFQHAVYYDGLMIVKCFHTCRGEESKGGHYHCPVCSTTLLKRNAFTRHLQSHAHGQGLGKNAVQAPDCKKPSTVYFEEMKIELCGMKCQGSKELHFHCPLCRHSCEQLSALTSHLWRCKKRAASVAAKAENGTGYTLDVSKLFSPAEADTVPHPKSRKELKWHLSIVRNLSDLPLSRCELPDCCKGRYHCPLCTTAKLKPNHLSHVRQHFVSHYRSSVKFRDYTVLVCYLPCQLENGISVIRFHYHCPLCGATRRRREGFSRHLLFCDPEQCEGQGSEDVMTFEEFDQDEDACMDLPPIPEIEVRLSQHSTFNTSQATTSRRASADQAELMAAESLADLDRIVMSSLHKPADQLGQTVEESDLVPAVDASKTSQLNNSLPSGKSPALSTVELSVDDSCANKHAVGERNTSVDQITVTATTLMKPTAESSSHIAGSKKSLGAKVSESSQAKPKEVPSTQEEVSLMELAAQAGKAIPDLQNQQHSHSVLKLSNEHSTDAPPTERVERNAGNCEHNLVRAGETESSDVHTEVSDLQRVSDFKQRSTQRTHQSKEMKAKMQTEAQISGVSSDTSCSQDHNINNVSQSCGKTKVSHEQCATDTRTSIQDCSEANLSDQSKTNILTVHSEIHVNDSQAKIKHSSESVPSSVPESSEVRKKKGYSNSQTEVYNTHDEANSPSIQIGRDEPSQPSVRCSSGEISEKNQHTEFETSARQSVDGGTCTEDKADHAVSGTTDSMQIFQQVSTQIADGIVSQLKARGDLQQSLQAIGQFCKVDWQQSGASVTMTCNLEELCYAQNCLKQILKDGLQSFLDSPPPKPPLADTTTATTSPPPPPSETTSTQSAKKRGRPKGSKNKSTLLREDQVDSSKQMKLMNNTVAANQKDMHKVSDSNNDVQKSGNATSPSQRSKDAEINSAIGCYSGRTRGKRINFAQLNAGNVSPSRDVLEEETKTSTSQSSPMGMPTKKPRGRPRKIQPAVNLKLTERAGTGTCSEDLTEEKFKGNAKNEGSQGFGDNCDDRGTKEPKLNSRENKTAPPELSVTENNLTSAIVHNLSGGNCGSKSGPPNLTIIVSLPGSASGELSASVDPQTISMLNSTNSRSSYQVDEEQEEGEDKHSERGRNLGGENVKDPAILRRGYRKRSGTGRDAASFAIIPRIVFNTSRNTEMEEDEGEDSEIKPLHENSSQDVEILNEQSFHGHTGLGNQDSAGDSEKEGEEQNEDTAENSKEESKLHSCPLCLLKFNSYCLLAQHVSSRHPKKGGIMCDVCEIACKTPAALILHLERQHGPKMECQTVTASDACKCSKCGKFCVSSSSLRWHQSLVHMEDGSLNKGRSKLKCTTCKYVAIDRWDMRQHRQQHQLKTPACPVCHKTLGSEAALKVHVAAKHSRETFTCRVCSKTFAHMRYLRSHMQRHEGQKRHACPVCGWRFHQTNTLQAHMDTHKPRSERKYAYKCPHCPAAYNSRANWKDHLNKHTGDKPHVCNKCGKGFAFRSMLTTHTAFVHSADRPHKCNKCEKKYKTKAQLRQHMLAHTMAATGISPFMCNKCHRPMASKSRLHAHLARCKGSKTYKVLWQPGVNASSSAHGNGAQAVDLVTGQSVKFEEPLLDLLPGQRVNILRHGFGKDATITLVPVENNMNTQNGSTVLISEAPTQGPTPNQSLILKQEGLDGKDEVAQGVLHSALTEIVSAANSQQRVLIQSSAQLGESSLGNLQSVVETVSSVYDSSTNQPFKNTHAVDVLSSIPLSGQLQSASASDQLGEMQYTLTSQSQVGSQSIVLNEVSQSETGLQGVGGSQQVILTDSLGQTQTILLPPEFVKQEVVVMEGTDGQQSFLDLSKVQIVHTDTTTCDLMNMTFTETDRSTTTDDIQMLASQTSEDAQSVQTEEPQNGDTDVTTLSENKVDETAVGMELGEIYMCSTCGQQFDSMAIAEQHILADHGVDPARSLPV